MQKQEEASSRFGPRDHGCGRSTVRVEIGWNPAHMFKEVPRKQICRLPGRLSNLKMKVVLLPRQTEYSIVAGEGVSGTE